MAERVTTYSRIDIQALAIVGKFLNKENAEPLNQSDLVNKAMIVLSDTLVENGLIQPVIGKDEAIEVLRNIGIVYNRGSRGYNELKGLGIGVPKTDRVSGVPRTESGGLDIEALKKDADRIARNLENERKAEPGDVAAPIPTNEEEE